MKYRDGYCSYNQCDQFKTKTDNLNLHKKYESYTNKDYKCYQCDKKAF